MISPSDGTPQRRLYGRRRGRALRAGQRALLGGLLPALRFELPASGKLDPFRLFPATTKEVWLEIGFGAGEHLAFQAGANPGCGLIGCEVFEPGIARLLAEIKSGDLANLRLFIDDARLLIAALAPRCLARVFILFPDPWPKERHKKRRIVATEPLDHLAEAMADGAELRLATDDADYAQWMTERCDSHSAFERSSGRARPPDWPETRYEKKAAAQGRSPRLLLYRRRARTDSGIAG